MKTPMQEVLSLVEQMYSNAKTLEVESAMNDVINIITQEGIEKEKNEICNAYVEGFNISGEGWNGEYGIKDFNNIKEEISAEEYYNDKFNIKTNNI